MLKNDMPNILHRWLLFKEFRTWKGSDMAAEPAPSCPPCCETRYRTFQPTGVGRSRGRGCGYAGQRGRKRSKAAKCGSETTDPAIQRSSTVPLPAVHTHGSAPPRLREAFRRILNTKWPRAAGAVRWGWDCLAALTLTLNCGLQWPQDCLEAS